MEDTYAGIPAELATPSASIYLQSIPYDGTSTWGKGANNGFDAFMDASANMELYDIETDSEVYKRGIHILEELTSFTSPKDMFNQVYRNTQALLAKDKFLTFFGGEHSISIGIIKAFYEHFTDISILQIDAHADLRPTYGGTPYNHACAVYDARKNAHLVQVGIRSMDIEEKDHLVADDCFFAHDIVERKDWWQPAIDRLHDKVYLTFDLDAFDSGIMPSTGTPEPGGLQWYPTMGFLKEVFTQREVVGLDIVELAPNPNNVAPDFLAAKLYYKLLTYKFEL